MPSAQAVNSVIDAIINKLWANRKILGEPATIYERYEPPPFINELPCIYVVPLMEGGDDITHFVDIDELEHNFEVVITGYYRNDELSTTTLRDIRNYGYTIIDLFAGQGKIVLNEGYVSHSKLEVGYWIIVDVPVFTFKVNLTIKAIL